MNIPSEVTQTRTEHGLTLHNYSKTAQHPSDASFWKGVITDESGNIVVRSYPWSPTEIVDDPNNLPVDVIYSPLYESTVIRFYMHDGVPRVSTHTQIDIQDKASRVSTGRPFMELIEQAISEWPYTESEYITEDGGKGLTIKPTRWQQLCEENAVHIFLLVDESNQITDLHNFNEHIGDETISELPLLLHALSLYRDGYGNWAAVQADGYIRTRTAEYDEVNLMVPHVPIITREEAMEILREGGAVIGRYPGTPDLTTKYYSPQYSAKLELAGETFNIVHRWHQLMDEDPHLAYEYLGIIPHHKEIPSFDEMMEINNQYIETAAAYLGDAAMSLYTRDPIDVPRKVLGHRIDGRYTVKDLLHDAVREVKGQHRRGRRPKKADLKAQLTNYIDTTIRALPYAKQHSIHSHVAKAKAGFYDQ